MNSFKNWWGNTGSSIRPSKDQDMEEHAEHISATAWNAAIEAAAESAKAKIEQAKDESGEYYTRCVVIKESILKLKKL